MKTLLALTLSLAAIGAIFADGLVSPYTYTYNGSPISAPVSAIDPPKGAEVIDINTGTRYVKTTAVGDNSGYVIRSVQAVTPLTKTSASTVTAGAVSADETIVVTASPNGTLAALTFVFPTNANSRIGQQITLLCDNIVTTLTVTANGNMINGTATTALAANVPVRWVKTAASTWVRTADFVTNSGVTITAPVITTGLTASGSASNDFSSSTGTFKTSTGANTLSGAVTVADATTPSITTAAGKTNTGFLQINGKTSGSTKLITADATAQAIVLSTAAQTVGGATITIPNQLGVNSTLSTCSTATLTAGATPAFAPGANISTYLLTPGEAETIAGTTTGAVAGKTYHIRVLTSGTNSYVLTFGANFKSTGTLTTGVSDAKTFVVSFVFDGTNFVEVSRTAAM